MQEKIHAALSFPIVSRVTNMDKIEGMKAELSRLLKERPALESERQKVFSAIDHAPHMTPDLREQTHELYNRKLARVQADISGIMKQIAKFGGGSA